MDLLICDKLSSQGPWPQRLKLGVRVAKGLSCDCTIRFFFFRWTPPPPPPPLNPLRYRVEMRRTTEICRTPTQICVVPPLLNSISQGGGGGSPEKKCRIVQSQLRPLATRTPSLGRSGQAAWLESLPQIRKSIFWVTLEFLDISSKKRCL